MLVCKKAKQKKVQPLNEATYLLNFNIFNSNYHPKFAQCIFSCLPCINIIWIQTLFFAYLSYNTTKNTCWVPHLLLMKTVTIIVLLLLFKSCKSWEKLTLFIVSTTDFHKKGSSKTLTPSLVKSQSFLCVCCSWKDKSLTKNVINEH